MSTLILKHALQNWDSMMLGDEYVSKETRDLWNGSLSKQLETELSVYVSFILSYELMFVVRFNTYSHTLGNIFLTAFCLFRPPFCKLLKL